MRKALVVGIDHYQHIPRLRGCVRDAERIAALLARNSDKKPNFTVKSLLGTGPDRMVSRSELKADLKDLFAGRDTEVALFYFAGHGYLESTGGYLQTSENRAGDEGLPFSQIMTLASKSAVRNKILILDSCHSGSAAARPADEEISELNDGMTILTASTPEQSALEDDGGGVFTSLLVDALEGAAANLVGDVTPGSAYAHIDQALGPWDEQRPVFKTNVTRFVSLRKVEPAVKEDDLRRLTEFFPTPGVEFRLNPSFEPESTKPNPVNTEKFAILQKLNRVNVVVPVGAPHMYHAAMRRKACQLTALGRHYWRLVSKGQI